MTRLVLVRHGESNVMVDGVIGGHKGCTGLSPLGVAQAEALRHRLARTGEVVADALMASVLPRAIETAEIIAPALGGLVPSEDCDLCELHPGESDGLTWEEHRVRYRPEGWTWDPHVPLAPGAESWIGVPGAGGPHPGPDRGRAPGPTVVIACHGGVVDSSLAVFLGLPFHGRLTELRTATPRSPSGSCTRPTSRPAAPPVGAWSATTTPPTWRTCSTRRPALAGTGPDAP